MKVYFEQKKKDMDKMKFYTHEEIQQEDICPFLFNSSLILLILIIASTGLLRGVC